MKKFITLLVIFIFFTNIFTGCQLFCEHNFTEADCCTLSTCTLCGKTEGELGEHSWKAATCTEARKCTLCEMSEGSALEHNIILATCTEAAYCSICNRIFGSALGHNIEEYICTVCGFSDVHIRDVPNIIDITKFTYSINPLDGIEPHFEVVNKSSNKTMKYITLNWSFYNQVDDIMLCDITKKDYAEVRLVGPIEPRKTGKFDIDRSVFYTSATSFNFSFNHILIEYMDGSKINLDVGYADEAVVNWRNN